jgi:hypothetical protein
MDIKTIEKILKALEKEPDRIVTSNLGSGCHARRYGDAENGYFHKVVIPGDTFSMASTQLHYLLFDLGVDVGLSDDELKTLSID